MTYKRASSPYRYTAPPSNPDSFRLWVEDQFRAVQRFALTSQEAETELQDGTSTGSTLSLAPTGTASGRFENPVITVRADGRIAAIRNGDAPGRELPTATAVGQVLTSSNQGPYWADPVREIPVEGKSGQVLTLADAGPVWTDLPTPPAPTTYSVRQGGDVVGAVSGTEIALALAPTGVRPGTYFNATITVDAGGRVSQIYTNEPADPIPTLYNLVAELPADRFWRVVVPGGFNSPDLDVGEVVFSARSGGDDLGGTETRDAGSITRDFGANVSVGAVTVTASSDPTGAPPDFQLQSSESGFFWTTVAQALPQPAWEAGETRVFDLLPVGTGGGSSEPPNSANNPETGRFEITPDQDVYFVYWTPTGYVGNIVAHHDSVKAGDGYEILAENGTDYIAYSG